MNKEGRIVANQLCDFFGRIASEIAIGLGIAALITLVFLLSPQWNASDSLVNSLVTINGLLIAGIGFLSSFVAEGSSFVKFANDAQLQYWKAVREHNYSQVAFTARLHSRSVAYLILLPMIAILPFFISVILALGALVTSHPLRSELAALSLFVMLWAFLSIPFVLWKLTIFQRTAINSAITNSS